MKLGTKILLGTVLTSGFLLMQQGGAMAETRDVVHDSNKHIVVNTFGNCVRTKWDAGMDACAPETAQAPEPAPVQTRVKEDSRSYLVFFDFDRYNLTEDAMQVLSNLFSRTGQAKAVHYQVIGHADRSGSDAYNMKLSQRRANSVKSELQRLGATGESVSVEWKGEREPLVPTDDGIKEPQNRRAEIKVRMEVTE